MRANNLVAAITHPNGVVILEGVNSNSVHIIGASVGNLPPTSHSSNSFSFSIKRGEKGMVALVVYVPNGKSGSTYYFFLGVKWGEEKEKPHIDLENQWVPEDPERLGCFYYDNLEVVIGGLTYSTRPYTKLEPQKRCVHDRSLLCRYMDSKLGVEELKEAMGAPAKEVKASEELVKAQAEIARLNSLVESCGQALDHMTRECYSAVQERDRWRRCADQSSINAEEYMAWKSAAISLEGAVKKQWFKSKAVDRALQGFPQGLRIE